MSFAFYEMRTRSQFSNDTVMMEFGKTRCGGDVIDHFIFQIRYISTSDEPYQYVPVPAPELIMVNETSTEPLSSLFRTAQMANLFSLYTSHQEKFSLAQSGIKTDGSSSDELYQWNIVPFTIYRNFFLAL